MDKYKNETEGFTFWDKTSLLRDVGNANLQYENILLPEELEHIEQLTSEPYVIIHPFGGQADRDVSEKDLNEIREENKGKKVYILGKNYDRISHSIEENPFEEWFDLIDKINIRETIELIKHANCQYIYASHSSILMLAWLFDKPNTCYYPANSDAEKQLNAKEITPYNFGVHYKNTTMKTIQL
jgi:hypothetical protein